MSPKRAVVKAYVSRAVIVAAIIAHNLETDVVRASNHNISLIGIRVSVVVSLR